MSRKVDPASRSLNPQRPFALWTQRPFLVRAAGRPHRKAEELRQVHHEAWLNMMEDELEVYTQTSNYSKALIAYTHTLVTVADRQREFVASHAERECRRIKQEVPPLHQGRAIVDQQRVFCQETWDPNARRHEATLATLAKLDEAIAEAAGNAAEL
eukprot:gene6369-29550_t